MPIVWCSDPNSSNKQPVAFALHGIQLEGNITAEHVTALKAMVNAATSGHMLLPTDGLVLLDCGIGISSTIVRSDIQSAVAIKIQKEGSNGRGIRRQSEIIADRKPICRRNDANGLADCGAQRRISLPVRLEPKYSEPPANEPGKYDVIYEFLCCAKCMNDTRKTDDMRKSNSNCLSSARKCQTGRSGAIHKSSTNRRRCSDSIMVTSHRRIARPRHLTVQAKRWQQSEQNRKLIAECVPLYATVNKHRRVECAEIRGIEKRDAMVINHGTPIRDNDDTVDAAGERVALNGVCTELMVSATDDLTPDSTVTDDGFQKKAGVNYPEQSSRKASLDSGFNEMQNKVEKVAAVETPVPSRKVSEAVPIPPIIITHAVAEKAKFLPGASDDEYVAGLVVNNLKECLTQSRNRRKSYEEFKAIYHRGVPAKDILTVDEGTATSTTAVPTTVPASVVASNNNNNNKNNNMNATNDKLLLSENNKDKIRARRKSYEEFKAMVRECNESENQLTNVSGASSTSTLSKCLSITKKKCPKAHMEKLAKINNSKMNKTPTANSDVRSEQKGDGDAVSLAGSGCGEPKTATTSAMAKPNETNKEQTYKENFKIYNKLISYGTIYDIIQKKTDILNKSNSKYDTYTYGTIYEILQRKSDDYGVFRRKRAASEKYTNRRAIETAVAAVTAGAKAATTPPHPAKQGSLNFGTIYDILHRRAHDASSSSVGSSPANTIVSSSASKSLSPRQLAKIYDILQNEKCEGAPEIATAGMVERASCPARNRFMVKRISEEDLGVGEQPKNETEDCNDEKPGYSEPVSPRLSDGTRRPRPRMRRFSNIVLPSCQRPGNGSLSNITENEGLYVVPGAIRGGEDEVDYLFMGGKPNAHAKFDRHKHHGGHEKIVTTENPSGRHASLDGSPTAAFPRKKMLSALDSTHTKHQFAISIGASARTNLSRDLSSNNTAGAAMQMPSHSRANAKSSANSISNSEKCMATPKELRNNGLSVGRIEKTMKSRRLSEFCRGEFLNEKP